MCFFQLYRTSDCILLPVIAWHLHMLFVHPGNEKWNFICAYLELLASWFHLLFCIKRFLYSLWSGFWAVQPLDVTGPVHSFYYSSFSFLITVLQLPHLIWKRREEHFKSSLQVFPDLTHIYVQMDSNDSDCSSIRKIILLTRFPTYAHQDSHFVQPYFSTSMSHHNPDTHFRLPDKSS